MAALLSETAVSNIGSVSLTSDATGSGVPIQSAVLEIVPLVSGVERTVAATLGGAVMTVIDYGTSGAEIRLRIPHCPAPLFDALLEQYADADTPTYDAEFTLKLLDSGDDETELGFDAVAWVSLTPNTDRSRGTMTDVRDVQAVLVSLQ